MENNNSMKKKTVQLLIVTLSCMGAQLSWAGTIDSLAGLRSRLQHAVQQSNKVQIVEKMDSATVFSQKTDYLALYPIEEWLIAYQTQQWDKLKQSIALYNESYLQMLSQKKLPLKDELYNLVQSQALSNQQAVEDNISISSQTDEDKQFLRMHYASCLQAIGSPQIQQESLNAQANEFMNQYTESQWNWYTRNYIRHEYSSSNWGIDFDLFAGIEPFKVSNKQQFEMAIPLGFGFGLYYGRVALQLRNYIGMSKVRENIQTVSTEWQRGSAVAVYKMEACLGFTAVESKHLRIIPLAGISTCDVLPTDAEIEHNRNYKGIGYKMFPIAIFGATFDYKFARRPQNTEARSEQSFWCLRCRAQYERSFNTSDTFDGFMVTLGIGGFARKITRKI